MCCHDEMKLSIVSKRQKKGSAKFRQTKPGLLPAGKNAATTIMNHAVD
jgi:hypothetical protein